MGHAHFYHRSRSRWFCLLRVLGVLSLVLLLVGGARAQDEEPCGEWHHASWIPGDVTWHADANGDPYATISDATEICEWADPCEGTTKDAAEHTRPYLLLSDTVVAVGGGYERHYSWRADPGCADGTPIWKTATHPLPRHWEAPPAISGGVLNGEAEREVSVGGQLGVSVTTASDNDTWRVFGGSNGQDADTITYAWSASGGSFDGATTNSAANWTAPAEAGTYTLTCVIDDTPKTIDEFDKGSRDDTAITRTITVTVTKREWDTGTPIGVKIKEDGTHEENGRITAPQDQTKPNPPDVIVRGGVWLTASIEAATDYDHWTKGEESGDEADALADDTYEWTASGGSFVELENGQPKKDENGSVITSPTKTGLEVYWLAPTSPGEYSLTCKIDDKPTAIPADETGDRDDAPLERTVTVKVYDAEFISVNRVGGTGSTVAAGSLTGEHQADFVIQITPAVAGVSVPVPTVKSGGYGMTADPDNPQFISAHASLNSGETNVLGQITGVFTSGHRTEDTVFEIDLNRGDSNPTGSIHQVWGNLPDGNSWDEEVEDNQPTYDVKWHYDPYFTIDDDLPVTYTIAFTEDEQAVPITGHSVTLSTISITGLEWNPTAGEDWDEDGKPDGAYMQETYSKQAAAAAQDAWDLLDPKPDDPPAELAKQINGWAKWSGLSTFGGTTSTGGHYTANRKIIDGINDADEIIFYVYEVGFDVTDFTAYDAE